MTPLLNSAYRGLQRELAENGVSVLAKQQDLSPATDPVSGVTPMEISGGARALAQDLVGTAQMAIENLIEHHVRPEQTKGRRRMPYSHHRRIVYL